MSRRSSMLEKNPVFLYIHGLGKTTCNNPDARATLSGCDLNMETHEARYGKAVAQFTIWTLYNSIRTQPREIQISGDLGILSL
jgi:hypothetical protein